ncbi:pyruvate dehydrogenase (acetyl-transferring) E1 component subunit alpha [Halobacteriales archaeon QH_10_70_21]|nr:MAG: pyruvate dehydrogenase (acetyl-transferring) E1 component subunit alpha [Halobacteriales archaeon QH_10_70_21]
MTVVSVVGTVTGRQYLSRDPGDTVRILDADGRVVEGATVPDLEEAELAAMYAEMVVSRHLDERMVSLQRQGRLGTYAPLAGQEGAQVGSTHALADDDWIVDQYREHGAVVVRGIEPEYLLYWMGHEAGNEWLAERHVLPLNISIGSHVPHATGMALAAKLRGDDGVVCCHFGDGATSEGDFHEGLNIAGTFDVPALFVCNNNQWAISIPREAQTASATLAGKAEAYGFTGVQVDGMDPLAVYAVTAAARHTTADDPSVYRDDEEVAAWKERDPIDRLEAYLRDRGLLDDERVAEIEAAAEAEVARLVDGAMGYDPDPDRMFETAYETTPPRLREQQRYLAALRERHDDGVLLRDE